MKTTKQLKLGFVTLFVSLAMSIGALAAWSIPSGITAGAAPASLAGSDEGNPDVGWSHAPVFAGSDEGNVDVG